jgi:hypothetical protein
LALTRQSSFQAKELSMIPSKVIASNEGPVPAESSQEKDVIADRSAPGPMPQQHAGDSHGHEMHPQKLVRLVGCHNSNAGKHEVARRLSA